MTDFHAVESIENMIRRSAIAAELTDDKLIDTVVNCILGQFDIDSKEELLLQELVDRFMIAKNIHLTTEGFQSSVLIDEIDREHRKADLILVSALRCYSCAQSFENQDVPAQGYCPTCRNRFLKGTKE